MKSATVELNRIYNEDCIETLKRMDDSVLDMTITSPPYDNLRTYNDFSFDLESIITELYRATKEGGVIVWVVGDATIKGSETGTSFKQALLFMEKGFNLHDTMIYEKSQSPFGSNLCYLQSFEYMFVFSKGRPKTLNLIRDRKNKRSGVESVAAGGLSVDGIKQKRIRKELKEYGRRKNIWKYGVGGSKIDHPAIFPEQLAKDHILSWSNDGDIIYDPFMGSGTTAKMAMLNNRNYVGSEISKEYCDVAHQRLSLTSEIVETDSCIGAS